MTVTAMLLVGIAIAVLLYIVVQRLDRIIILQTERRKEHLDALNRHRLLRAAHRKEIEKAEDKDLAYFASLKAERDTDAT